MRAKIVDISHSGNGVCKIDGKTYFVPYTDIGEEVELEMVESHKSYAIASAKKVISQSKDRVESPCPYFFQCGGCNFQFVTYERELEIKQIILQNELKKVGFANSIEIEPSKERFSYRNKIKLVYKEGKLGYYSNSHEFVAINNCLLASEKIQNAIKWVREFLKDQRFNSLKNVIFREYENVVDVVFFFKHKEKFDLNGFLKDYNVYTAYGEIFESDKTKLELVSGDKNRFDPRAFMQVNDYMAEKLYAFVSNEIEGDVVINAYSGQGFLTKILAERCKKVFGVEVQKSSHDMAEKIKLPNMVNINDKVENVIDSLVQNENADTIVLDPARAGCDNKVLNAIVSSKILKIIYVSCNFATLVRDLKVLTKDFNIKTIKAFDMFPNTANIETCVILTRK